MSTRLGALGRLLARFFSSGIKVKRSRQANPPESMEEGKSRLRAQIESSRVVLFGSSQSPTTIDAKELVDSLNVDFKSFDLDQIDDGRAYADALSSLTQQSKPPYLFVGGEHVADIEASHKSGRIAKLLGVANNVTQKKDYDYDLVVIGGGSGGMACSKQAASLGAKVACLDFVLPSPVGTSWGLGGTCVNVGCIPKKLMHQASLLGEAIEDAKKFGWQVGGGGGDGVTHNWSVLVEAVQNHVKSLNWGYRTALSDKSVKYLNAYGELIDEHTIKTVNKRKKESQITAANIVIATGERPRYPDIPGAKEHCITSDDLFSMTTPPGRTLVVGASYVALECAGFLAGVGFDVSCMVRSIFLRGFDQGMADKIGDHMGSHGVKFIRPAVPTKVELIEEGPPKKLRVEFKNVKTGEMSTDEFNTVLLAIGRDSCTKGIGLEKVGVKMNPQTGRLLTTYEQTNVPHIYGIGDILQGKPQLTPVAIQAGKLLAKRLFGGSTIECDYVNVPTTVFTPLEYGCIGLSEEDAIVKYGEDNLEIYHTYYQPLEWTVPGRAENICYMKLICDLSDKERVVGFHVLGPNAGEITQGFGVAVKAGATKAHFDEAIGIHPTCAENFTLLNITKRSGEDPAAKGC